MASTEPTPCPLLQQQLDDNCLDKFVQCCAANDPFSMFSVSKAHSRLHKAAAAALSSIKAEHTQERQLEGVMAYLGEHGSHVSSISFACKALCPASIPCIRELPLNLRLSKLQLQGLQVQLQLGRNQDGEEF